MAFRMFFLEQLRRFLQRVVYQVNLFGIVSSQESGSFRCLLRQDFVVGHRSACHFPLTDLQ